MPWCPLSWEINNKSMKNANLGASLFYFLTKVHKVKLVDYAVTEPARDLLVPFSLFVCC